jgi:hypothetical protein
LPLKRGEKVDSLDKDYAAGLLEACKPPCLSLYQLTHRHYPENRQDQIRLSSIPFNNINAGVKINLKGGFVK